MSRKIDKISYERKIYPKKESITYTIRKNNRLTIPSDIDQSKCFIGFNIRNQLLIGDLQKLPNVDYSSCIKLNVSKTGNTPFIILGEKIKNELNIYMKEGGEITFLPREEGDNPFYELTAPFQDCAIHRRDVGYNTTFYSISVSKESLKPFSAVDVNESYLTLVLCRQCLLEMDFITLGDIDETSKLNEFVEKQLTNAFFNKLSDFSNQKRGGERINE